MTRSPTPLLRRALALALPLWLLGGCAMGGPGDDTFAIVAPADGSWVGSNAVRVQGVVGDRAIREVRVAGQPVSVSGGEFQVTLRLPDGPNEIYVTGGDHEALVAIQVDGQAPTVTIDEPPAGTFIEGETVLVRGHIDDGSDAVITVDGERIALAEDGSFNFTRHVAPGAHRLRVVARDAVGHVGSAFTSFVSGTFGDVDRPAVRAISVALGEAALEAIGAVAAPHLSPENVRPLVMAANPIADGIWGEVHTTGEDHDPATITLTPGDGNLELVASVPNVAVPFEARLPLGIDITGTAYVERAVIRASAAVGAEGGLPAVDLEGSDVTLEGVLIDVDGLWDWVDEHIVTWALRGTIEDSLRETVRTEIPPALEGALASLPNSHELEVAGYRAGIEGSLSALTATQLGLHAVLDFGIRPIGGPGTTVVAAPGPILLGVGEEPSNTPLGIEGAVTVDLLNHALFAAWGVGGLSYRMDQVMGPNEQLIDVGLLNIVIPIEGVERSAPVAVEVSSLLPPIVEETATGLVMTAADLRVRFYAPGASGEERRLASVSCSIRAAVRPMVGPDGLGLEVEELEVHIDALDEVRLLPPAEDLDRILGDLLTPMLEEHGRLSGFQLPSVAGFHVGADELFVDDGYVVFRGQLEAE